MKDFVALAALIISLFNLWTGFVDKRKTRQLLYEQKRQELISLIWRCQSATEITFSKAARLARDCDIWLGAGNGLSATIRGNVAMVSGKYAFDEAERLLREYARPLASSHDRLVEIEGLLGKARRKLEESQVDIFDVEESYKIWLVHFEKARSRD